MKITRMPSSRKESFQVDIDGQYYQVTIWLNESGKFVDWMVLQSGLEVDEDLEEQIMKGIEERWETLTA